jgi:hypothetical protein
VSCCASSRSRVDGRIFRLGCGISGCTPRTSPPVFLFARAALAARRISTARYNPRCLGRRILILNAQLHDQDRKHVLLYHVCMTYGPAGRTLSYHQPHSAPAPPPHRYMYTSNIWPITDPAKDSSTHSIAPTLIAPGPYPSAQSYITMQQACPSAATHNRTSVSPPTWPAQTIVVQHNVLLDIPIAAIHTCYGCSLAGTGSLLSFPCAKNVPIHSRRSSTSTSGASHAGSVAERWWRLIW